MKYYLAYGMNTNLSGMAERCPDATSVGKAVLDDHVFKFKYHADAEFSPGNSMECAVWLITDQCERNLDSLEGYPYYYDKKIVAVELDGKTISAMVYFMNNGEAQPPDSSYLDCLIEGYFQHGLNFEQLYNDSFKEIN